MQLLIMTQILSLDSSDVTIPISIYLFFTCFLICPSNCFSFHVQVLIVAFPLVPVHPSLRNYSSLTLSHSHWILTIMSTHFSMLTNSFPSFLARRYGFSSVEFNVFSLFLLFYNSTLFPFLPSLRSVQSTS